VEQVEQESHVRSLASLVLFFVRIRKRSFSKYNLPHFNIFLASCQYVVCREWDWLVWIKGTLIRDVWGNTECHQFIITTGLDKVDVYICNSWDNIIYIWATICSKTSYNMQLCVQPTINIRWNQQKGPFPAEWVVIYIYFERSHSFGNFV